MARIVFGIVGAAMLWTSMVVPSMATVYNVGDTAGWTMGTDYTSWTSDKTFVVGDSLVFNYGGGHTVDQVSKSDYSACSNGNSISTDGSGATTIPLKTAGDHYFICGAMGHCSSGMKLAVSVKAASPSTSTTTTPSTTPTETDSSSTMPSTTTTTTTTSSPPSTRTTNEPSKAAVVAPVGAFLGSLVVVFVGAILP